MPLLFQQPGGPPGAPDADSAPQGSIVPVGCVAASAAGAVFGSWTDERQATEGMPHQLVQLPHCRHASVLSTPTHCGRRRPLGCGPTLCCRPLDTGHTGVAGATSVLVACFVLSQGIINDYQSSKEAPVLQSTFSQPYTTGTYSKTQPFPLSITIAFYFPLEYHNSVLLTQSIPLCGVWYPAPLLLVQRSIRIADRGAGTGRGTFARRL